MTTLPHIPGARLAQRLTDEAEMIPAPHPSRSVHEAQQAAGGAAPASKPLITVTALLDGFPVSVAFHGTADQIKPTIARLRELGAVPPTPAAAAAVEAERQREAPRCKYHGPMKESTARPGTWYCPKKMGDDSYCKEKA